MTSKNLHTLLVTSAALVLFGSTGVAQVGDSYPRNCFKPDLDEWRGAQFRVGSSAGRFCQDEACSGIHGGVERPG